MSCQRHTVVFRLRICKLRFVALLFGLSICRSMMAGEPDLVNWGDDHVGQAIPDYITGDECLFCHRNVGSSWPTNPHQTTLRNADSGLIEIQSLASRASDTASEVDFLLGSQRSVRYLKRSQSYGKLDLLSASYRPAKESPSASRSGSLVDFDKLSWNAETFGDHCAGCHSTSVDSVTRTLSATSLDCYVCHGAVDLEHTSDVSKVLLSKHPQQPRVVNAICSSCHLRGGTSRTTSLPYPNAFVPGDNLFLDFQVDLSDSAIAALPAMQQHIYLNARMVGIGRAEPTCVDCHSVHGNHSQQHVELRESGICNSCHVPGTGNGQLIEALINYDKSAVHNATCEY